MTIRGRFHGSYQVLYVLTSAGTRLLEKKVSRFEFTVLTRSLRDVCTRYKVKEGDLPSEARCQTDFVAREYGTLFPREKNLRACVCKDGAMVMRKPGKNSIKFRIAVQETSGRYLRMYSTEGA